MWTSRTVELPRRGTRTTLERAGAPASYRAVIDAWQRDPAFCAWFNDLLVASSFTAFRWETPPITSSTNDRPFEFVLLDSPSLDRPAQQSDFAEHFDAQPTTDVLTFENLGGDAVLVVPRPLANDDAYVHLAAFVRGAPREQQLALWAAVGRAMAARLSARPVWLSTAGAGVAWLHVRLDDRPKYYGFDEYRELAAAQA